MPGIDLSTLNGPDLRRLLRIAHDRNDGPLADRLEWEIAARAASVVRPLGSFATLPEDDHDELADGVTGSDAAPLAPEPTAQAPASGRSVVLLVTLGAVAGSLISATVFWGLGRMDRLSSLDRAEPQPARAMSVGPAAPVADQLVAVLTPEPFPSLPEPMAPATTVEAAVPAATPPADVARKAAPPRKAQGKQMAAKAPGLKKHAALKRKAARAGRPPTLAEWLAKAEPEEPIH
jgi:hypothetical protein